MPYLLAPDQPLTKVCPDCENGDMKIIHTNEEIAITGREFHYEQCHRCGGEGEVLIDNEKPEKEKDDE